MKTRVISKKHCMQKWIIVCGLLLLPIAWTHQGRAQDVGTPACREAQLTTQADVGNETNPPYKNHGQYVSAASNATDPAVLSGQITADCQGCIVSQFAHSTPISKQQACGPGSGCDQPGGLFWGNMVRFGGNAAFPAVSTAQDCCKACLADSNCAQWFFIISSCELNVPPNQCVSPTLSPVPNGGIVRCP